MELELEAVWEEYGFEKLQTGLDSLFPQYQFSLEEVLEKIWAGDIPGVLGELFLTVAEGMLGEMGGFKNIFVWLLLLGLAASVMTHFVEVFHKQQIARLSFYFMYLLFVTILFRCFVQMAETATQVMENLVLFIQLMVPTFLLSVGVATGSTTVSAYSQLLVLVVYSVQQLLGKGVAKLISVYVVLSLLNGIWIEERLSLLADCVKKIISLILKTALGVVTGISIFQTLITPVIDSAKSSLLEKAVSAIPGIGNVSGGVLELVVGSAVIIKNSIGVIILILLVAVCMAPLLQIFVMGWLLRIAAALLGLLTDRRLVECTGRVAEGCLLLLRLVATAMLLFFIIIAVLATATNRGF